MVDDATPPDESSLQPIRHRVLTPRALWGLAVVAMALDVAITGVGLSLGFRERNPVARAFIETGGLLFAGVALKGGCLLLGYVCWRLVPRVSPALAGRRNLVPLGVALPSWVAVGLNAALVLPAL